MSGQATKARHITKGSVFDDLGFAGPEAASLKVKAKILSALLEHIRRRRYTQAQLVQLLDDYQPNVSNLLNGKISKMSIEKLLYYGQRLNLDAEISLKSKPRPVRPRKTRVA
ncbi:MAG TPA: helix-turn-helix transcriptional regulator [Candidatus Angelobacter sp.]|nr:helix-turn-helix transcriptional regulator [Candidatus Angelobacter sp.]